MTPNAGREASEAQGQNNGPFGPKGRTCSRCTNLVPSGESVCPDCGNALDGHQDGNTFEEIHLGLAQANVHRVRGEMREAKDATIGLLKRFPHSEAAHEFLADLAFEQGYFPEAIQWYELALDLDPKSSSLAEKLTQAKSGHQFSDESATSQLLGVKSDPVQGWRFAAISLGIICVLVLTGFFMNQGKPNSRYETLSVPIQAPPQNPGVIDLGETAKEKPAVINESSAVLAQSLSASLPEGHRIYHAVFDPRSDSLMVDLFVTPGDDFRKLIADLAQPIFDLIPKSKQITFHASLNDNMVYAADISRAKLEETKTEAWRAINSESKAAWMDAILENEWIEGKSSKVLTPDPSREGLDGVNETIDSAPNSKPGEPDSPGGLETPVNSPIGPNSPPVSTGG